MTESPFFSIIIPTHNRIKFLPSTVESILNQTFKSFEIIIIDNESIDETSTYCNSIKDERVYYYYQKNKERANARNKGMQLAKGQYITFIDSDDILYSNHFQEAFDFINKTNSTFFFLNYEQKNILTGKIKQKKIKKNLNLALLKGNFISCMGIFLHNELIKKYKFSEDTALLGSEDWELWIRISMEHELKGLNKITSCQIEHIDRASHEINSTQFFKRMESLINHLNTNELFMKKYSTSISSIKAHMLTYYVLHKLIISQKSNTLHYLWQAFLLSPKELLQKRTLAIIKLYLFN